MEINKKLFFIDKSFLNVHPVLKNIPPLKFNFTYFFYLYCTFAGRHDTQHNDIQHNDNRYNNRLDWNNLRKQHPTLSVVFCWVSKAKCHFGVSFMLMLYWVTLFWMSSRYVIMLSDVLLSVIVPSVIMPSVVMFSVVYAYYCVFFW